MDITKYPTNLKDFDDKINTLRTVKEAIEYDLLKRKTNLTAEVDKVKFKSNQIRENFISLAIVNDSDCDKMTLKLLEIAAELRELAAQHAKIRREYRILENEFMAHGIRTFDACKPR